MLLGVVYPFWLWDTPHRLMSKQKSLFHFNSMNDTGVHCQNNNDILLPFPYTNSTCVGIPYCYYYQWVLILANLAMTS